MSLIWQADFHLTPKDDLKQNKKKNWSQHMVKASEWPLLLSLLVMYMCLCVSENATGLWVQI